MLFEHHLLLPVALSSVRIGLSAFSRMSVQRVKVSKIQSQPTSAQSRNCAVFYTESLHIPSSFLYTLLCFAKRCELHLICNDYLYSHSALLGHLAADAVYS